jgi:plasmid stabilization system protein ParE
MPHELIVFKRAQIDIEKAAAWMVSEWSLHTASQWHTGIWKTMRTLAKNPERYPLAHEAESLGIPLRELLYRRKRTVYRILFTIEADRVCIHRVRHAAQDDVSESDLA